MSLGIKAIGSYIPDNAIDNIKQAECFGETEEFIRTKIGAVKLPRMGGSQDTSDLAVAAVTDLFSRNEDLDPTQIDALVVVTQNPDACGLPHTSALVQAKLGLPTTVAAFDISLGCSGYVYGLYTLKGFLEASGLKNGILVTVDPYSKIVDPEDRVTALLFGDAATATWIGEKPKLELGLVKYGTDGSGADNLIVVDNKLKMNGRQVFNFAAVKVPPQIKGLIDESSIELDDVDLFCIHQGSGAIVDAIARRFGDSSKLFVKSIEDTGNTVSSSVPLILKNYIDDSDVKNVIVSGFGVGLSWATALLKRTF